MTNDDFALNADLAPTILAATDTQAPQTMQGQDLSPLYLADAKPNWRQEYFYEFSAFGGNIHRIPSSQALVSKEWKYMVWPDFQREQLFHLTEDPREEKDLIDDPSQAQRLADMRARLVKLREQAK